MRIFKRFVFYIDYLRVKRQAKASGMYFPFGKFYPCLEDGQWFSFRALFSSGSAGRQPNLSE